jgi:hypothetical protein
MIKKTLKYIFFSLFLILTLSTVVNERTIFQHIYAQISGFTIPTQILIESYLVKGASSTKKISVDIFKNSIPKMKDSVKASLSAPIKNSPPLEDIPIKDKNQLNKLLNE